jgi:small subunit ribosomal protein S6
MRHYETIFIVHPDLTEEDTTAVVDKFRGILEDGGGFLVKEDHWGRRRLAYTVKKLNKGYFVLFEYGAEAPAVTEMERNFKIDEQVIRYLTVKLSDNFDQQAMAQAKAEAEAAKAEAEAAKAEAEASKAEAEAAKAEDAGEGKGQDAATDRDQDES